MTRSFEIHINKYHLYMYCPGCRQIASETNTKMVKLVTSSNFILITLNCKFVYFSEWKYFIWTDSRLDAASRKFILFTHRFFSNCILNGEQQTVTVTVYHSMKQLILLGWYRLFQISGASILIHYSRQCEDCGYL